MKILRCLSAYLDDELTRELCQEVHRHLHRCPRCEVMLQSLQQTILLCRHLDAKPLSPSLNAQLHRAIYKAITQAAGR